MVTQEKKLKKAPVGLVILDGFGYRKETSNNAIALAQKPIFSSFLKNYPYTFLQASGKAVGLPEGQMGNSEVGHLTLGAGRIINQDITRILTALDDGSFFSNELLIKLFKTIAQKKSNLQLIGLLSDAGIHSHEKILYTLLSMAKKYGIKNTFVHAFLDGRDVPPQSASHYLEKLEQKFTELNYGSLGSITGRFYAMDRDHNWDRTQKTYTLLTTKEISSFNTWQQTLNYFYKQNISDEFIPPTQLNPKSIFKDHDGVLFFNIRADRARQLTASFADPTFNHFPTKQINLSFFATMTDYDSQKNIKTTVIFKPIIIENTLKEVLEQYKKTIFAIAETEKYAHVTYFFNGGKEKKLAHETRILIPSIHAKNYVKYPCMSAPEITKAILNSLQTDPKDFYLINYANADMVGHSGDLKATIKAIECLDEQLGILYKEFIEKQNGTLYITADHGNAEEMVDEKTGQPKTSHTANPVYFLMLQKEVQPNSLKELHSLRDIAPFILKNMNILIPSQMKK